MTGDAQNFPASHLETASSATGDDSDARDANSLTFIKRKGGEKSYNDNISFPTKSGKCEAGIITSITTVTISKCRCYENVKVRSI